jgi:hypothetical protein
MHTHGQAPHDTQATHGQTNNRIAASNSQPMTAISADRQGSFTGASSVMAEEEAMIDPFHSDSQYNPVSINTNPQTVFHNSGHGGSNPPGGRGCAEDEGAT